MCRAATYVLQVFTTKAPSQTWVRNVAKLAGVEQEMHLWQIKTIALEVISEFLPFDRSRNSWAGPLTAEN